ncbi:MAG: hypothetical protein EPN79_00465 [Burkholderiaceae bacterium]|nr:MAG: hypothetical protein EPN79_00465 [Burkholderiaceae bacterium]TBR76610.1 MAG: hypothetical protein EPN64_06670 [Burkholderiaceae bacterium]
MPFASGGLIDTMARIVGQKVGDVFKQTVIIDNRPGATANLDAGLAARAAPDDD